MQFGRSYAVGQRLTDHFFDPSADRLVLPRKQKLRKLKSLYVFSHPALRDETEKKQHK